MTAANVLLIIAAIAWILARQVRREPIKVRLLVAAPLALGYFGLGFCNLRMGRNDLAQTNFQLAVKYDPQGPRGVARPDDHGLA